MTMYELLGMVKDDKAPKKIKYQDLIYTYDKEIKDYVNWFEDNSGITLFNSANITPTLNNEVEILEEEKKIPDKLYKYMEKEEEGCFENILKVYDGAEYEINEDMSFVIDKINEIIDYLKSKGDNNE